MSRFYSPYYYNKQKLNCKIIMNIFENLTAFPQFRVIFTLKKQDYSCSTVSLHKPCSVLQWSGSHLSAFFQTPHRMISLHLRQVPLPNLGFFLAEFTSFQQMTSDCRNAADYSFSFRNTAFSKRVNRFRISMLSPLSSAFLASTSCFPSNSTIFAFRVAI